MIKLNNQHLQDKNNWDAEIRDLENQIAMFNEGLWMETEATAADELK